MEIHELRIFPLSRTVMVRYSSTIKSASDDADGLKTYTFKYVKKSPGGLTIQSLLASIEKKGEQDLIS